MPFSPLVIAGQEFKSRFFLGTGKFKNKKDLTDSIESSGTQMVTVSDAISGPDDWTSTQDNYPPGRPIIPGDFYPAATGAGQGRVLRGGFANGQRS